MAKPWIRRAVLPSGAPLLLAGAMTPQRHGRLHADRWWDSARPMLPHLGIYHPGGGTAAGRRYNNIQWMPLMSRQWSFRRGRCQVGAWTGADREVVVGDDADVGERVML